MQDETDPVTPDIEMPLPETVDMDVEPAKHTLWRRLIIDRNPLFLISGVFMLVGCFLVSRSIHEHDPVDIGESTMLWLLIALLLVLNIYEFAVIGVGLALAKSKTLVRDARHLLGLALLLLIDAGFVYTEIGIAEPMVGLLIAAIATGLACVKLWLILRVLGIRRTLSATVVTAMSLAGMYGLPILLRLLANDGFLSQAGAMALWTGVGLIVGLHALPRCWYWTVERSNADYRQLQNLMLAGVILLPIISLMGHAVAALWVYQNTFEPAMLSPVLLGLTAVILRHPDRLGGIRPAAQAATLFVASAIVSSLMPSEDLTWVSSEATWLAASPLRFVLFVSPLLLGWAWWQSGRKPIGFFNVCLPCIAAMLGHTPDAMLSQLNWIYVWASAYQPRTKLGWGSIAIGLAFASLLLGAALSWFKHEAADKATV